MLTTLLLLVALPAASLAESGRVTVSPRHASVALPAASLAQPSPSEFPLIEPEIDPCFSNLPPAQVLATNEVIKFRSFVRVSGAVKTPDFYFYDSAERPRLLSALAQAGSFTAGAGTEKVRVSQPGEAPRIVNILAAMTNSDLNFLVTFGTEIRVPFKGESFSSEWMTVTQKYFSLSGEVKKPNYYFYDFDRPISARDAIRAAGGVNSNGAVERVQLRRLNCRLTVDCTGPDRPGPAVRPHDVIYVPSRMILNGQFSPP
jgi:protein involved in polysaccharide export with SLBB domain